MSFLPYMKTIFKVTAVVDVILCHGGFVLFCMWERRKGQKECVINKLNDTGFFGRKSFIGLSTMIHAIL